MSTPSASGPQWGVLLAALLAGLAGALFVGFRLVVPVECAWLPPDAGAFSSAGVLPEVQQGCQLASGSLVSDARVVAGRADLTVEPGSRIVSLALVAQPASLARQAWQAGGTLVFVTALFGLCGLAIRRRPRDPAAGSSLVFSTALLGSTLVTVAGLPPSWAFGGLLRWLYVANVGFCYTLAWAAMLAWALQFPVPLTARLGGSRVRAMITWGPPVLWAGLAAILGAGTAFPGWMARAVPLQTGFTLLLLSASLVLIVVRLVRSRREGGDLVQRQQLLWLGGSGLVSGLLVLGLWIIPSLLIGQPLLPSELIGLPGLCYVAGMSVAMLRYRLFDLDVVLARALVYAALTAVSVIVYLLTVAVLTAFVANQPTGVAVVGAITVAIMVNPVRVRLEGLVSRTIYGDRDDPYVALARLAGLLTAREVSWSAVAEDLRRALRVPFVSVRVDQATVVESGAEPADPARSVTEPLVHADIRIGSLVIATRGRGERFAPSELSLLRDLGNQVALALHQERLDREVRASRGRLVLAREEERRRLRRTLHDDLGPTMAAIPLRAATARRLLGPQSDPGVVELLGRIEQDATRAAEGVRRLAYDLRPPALDELGLVRALEDRIAVLALEVSLDAADFGPSAPSLPAEVEVAAYRIVSAALDNASRHAQARTCRVSLRRVVGAVEIEVADDGVGLPLDFRAGVGVTAMRERAAELGGACTIGPADGGGTLVRASLPTGGQP